MAIRDRVFRLELTFSQHLTDVFICTDRQRHHRRRHAPAGVHRGRHEAAPEGPPHGVREEHERHAGLRGLTLEEDTFRRATR